jgi:hypothetical protein
MSRFASPAGSVRIDRYWLAVLAKRFGADADAQDVLETISASCGARIDPKQGLRCGAFLPDIPATTAAGLATGIAAA